MAAGVTIKFRMAEFVAIANAVNAEVCQPLAEAAASRARSSAPVESGSYRESIHVGTDPRSGVGDWAHSYVVADAPHAMRVESRHGVLGRSLG